jgi:hypothetical protein
MLRQAVLPGRAGEAELNHLKIGDLSNFYTNELIDPINDFDAAKIQAQAVTFKR